MGNFTRLEDTDVADLAAAFDLGPVLSWRPIAAGTINTNAGLVTERGSFFLRINEGKTEADVRYEAALVDALADAGVAAPRPVRAPDGAPLLAWRDRFVSVFPWVAGAHRLPSDPGFAPADAAAVGRTLAGLHLAGLPLADTFAHAGIYTTAHIAKRFRGFQDSDDPALAPALAAIGDELARLEGQADARARAPTGVIHGDLFPDNVLWENGRLVALLDFEQASTGSLAYDLAVCINAWTWRAGFDAAIARALVAGYQGARALTADEIAVLPAELRAAAVRFTVTRITDVYLPGFDGPGKDFRDFLARLSGWRTLGDDGARALLGC